MNVTYILTDEQKNSQPPRSHAQRLLVKLLPLIIYAKEHPHSSAWTSAILTILERRLGVARG
jgi:hypothetical protein